MATGSGRRFPLPFGRGLSPGNHTRFSVSPHRTVREVFPHTALLQEIRVVYQRCLPPSPLASSEDSEAHSPRFLALAMRLSQSPSETPAAGALPSPGVMLSPGSSVLWLRPTPSQALPDLGSALYQESLPYFFSRGPRGPPQLTRPLSRHVAPDTPEEPRAASPVLHPEIPASPLRYRVALPNSVFTRLRLGSLQPAGSRRLLPETLSGRLDAPVAGMHPAPYGADRHLPRSAPSSRLERRGLLEKDHFL